jgi:glycosyltransferase involved in cell wall biosynthesis
MLSIIIPTRDSERPLVPTLAALVPGATAGLISEVIIADAGSRDETAVVADIAGCNFLALAGPSGRRLRAAAAAARAPWLLFLKPGTLLDSPWISEARRFIEQPASVQRAAVFRRGTASPSALREAFALLAVWARPAPEQGLLIAKAFYQTLGGHAEHAADAERELIRRIGGRRTAVLATMAFFPKDT